MLYLSFVVGRVYDWNSLHEIICSFSTQWILHIDPLYGGTNLHSKSMKDSTHLIRHCIVLGLHFMLCIVKASESVNILPM